METIPMEIDYTGCDIESTLNQNSQYGNKAANLFVLQELVVNDNELEQKLYHQTGYNIQVPKFCPISNKTINRFLGTQHINPNLSVKNIAKHTQQNDPDFDHFQEADRVSQKIKGKRGKKHKHSTDTKWFGTHKIKKTDTVLKQESDFGKFIHESKQENWSLVVRSTGMEDTEEDSNAGGNESILNVSPHNYQQVKQAINDVADSYLNPKSSCYSWFSYQKTYP